MTTCVVKILSCVAVLRITASPVQAFPRYKALDQRVRYDSLTQALSQISYNCPVVKYKSAWLLK